MRDDSTLDAIVIGGGIIGASCAFHLAQSGLDDVLILEKDSPASKASGRAAGHLGMYKEGETDDIRHYCISFYENLTTDHNITLYETSDYVLAHSENGVTHLEQLENDNNELAFLSPSELEERVPEFNTNTLTGALVYDDATHTDPYTVTMGILEEARDIGVTLTIEEMTGLERTEKGFEVWTSEERYTASTVVNAAGAWTPRIADFLDVQLPVRPRTSQIAILEPERDLVLPMFHCPDLGLYGRHEPNGDILIGGGSTTPIPDPHTFSTNARDAFIRQVSKDSSKIAAELDNAHLKNDWAGRCTATPDRRPLIGETGVEGFYICAGFNGGGIARAPFAGRLLADILTGAPSSFDPRPFDPSRFDEVDSFDIKSITTNW